MAMYEFWGNVLGSSPLIWPRVLSGSALALVRLVLINCIASVDDQTVSIQPQNSQHRNLKWRAQTGQPTPGTRKVLTSMAA